MIFPVFLERKSILVNSGSSANLLAIAALGSHRLSADKRLKSGDEIITVSAGFPTTVASFYSVDMFLYLLMQIQ